MARSIIAVRMFKSASSITVSIASAADCFSSSARRPDAPDKPDEIFFRGDKTCLVAARGVEKTLGFGIAEGVMIGERVALDDVGAEAVEH